MTTIGNTILILVTGVYFGLIFTLFARVPGGSDAAAGYAWLSVILNLVLLAGLSVISLIISRNGGFNWISTERPIRLMVVLVGLFAAMFTCGLCAVFNQEKERIPAIIRYVVTLVPVLIPAVMIISEAILLNSGLRGSIPLDFYKWPLTLVFVMGIGGFGYAVFAFERESRHEANRKVKSITEDQDLNRQRILKDIDSCDVTKDLVFILVYTDANQYPEVRSRAVAKVNTAANWQKELIRLLQTDWAPQAFTFLASNQVPDVTIFPEAINQGILIQAKLIRETISKNWHPSNFYPGLFSWEVERVLRTADAFEKQGVDFLPAVKQLRQALNEPSEFKKPKFDCVALLDEWISKHE